MEEKKLTDEELKKAFFILRHGSAEGLSEYVKAVLAIENEYNRQKAEIERLTEENGYLKQCADNFLADYQNAKKQVDILQESHFITFEMAKRNTAKEILQDLFYFIDGNNFWLEETGNQVYLIKEKDALNFMRKKASEYEVEVEE